MRNIKKGKAGSVAIKCWYPFQGQAIQCDSRLEYSCLNWFETHHQVVSMGRAQEVLRYDVGDGVRRRYLPDFEIKTESETFIVECKSDFFPSKMSSRAGWYVKTQPAKREALERYAASEGL